MHIAKECVCSHLQMQMAKSTRVVFKVHSNMWYICEEICYIDPTIEANLPAYFFSFNVFLYIGCFGQGLSQLSPEYVQETFFGKTSFMT